MGSIESEGRGGRNPPAANKQDVFGVRLTGPIENLLQLENIHPDHGYDDSLSRDIYNTYNRYINEITQERYTGVEEYATNRFIYTSIRDIFYSKEENKITILLNIEFSAALMRAVVRDICGVCKIRLKNLIAFFFMAT